MPRRPIPHLLQFGVGLLILVALVGVLFGPLFPLPQTSAQVLAQPLALRGDWTATSRLYEKGMTADGRKQYILDASIGWQNYLDSNGEWQEIDLQATEADTGAFTIRWTKLPMLVRMGNDSYRCVYPDRNDLSYWICLGKPFPNMGAPTRDGNTFTWDFPVATLEVTIGSSGVKFDILLKNSNAPTSMTIPFETQGISRNGRLLYHDGQVVAELRRPFAIDANDVERDLTMSFQSDSVSIFLDDSGLVYPIVIDPTLDMYVGGSDDDATENNDGTNFSASGATLYVYSGVVISQAKSSGFRFPNVAIGQGDTINNGTYWAPYIWTAAYDMNADIHTHDVDNSDDFASTADVISRARGVSFSWVEDDVGSGLQASPEAKTIIQERVDSGTWSSGNAITVLAIGKIDAYKAMQIASYDSGAQYAAKLHIEFTAGGAAPRRIIIIISVGMDMWRPTGLLAETVSLWQRH